MLSLIKWILKRYPDSINLHAYWNARAKKYGRRAVLNISHGEEEYERITELQKKLLFPMLSSMLTGQEKTILDFGCGPGRFTDNLAAIINGHAVGVDISYDLIRLAPISPNVTYRLIPYGKLPDKDFFFDIIWICLVLGGIPDSKILHTVSSILNSLNKGGLLFLIENTSNKLSNTHWFFRSHNYYKKIFEKINLEVIGTYEDLGEEISILAGRKVE